MGCSLVLVVAIFSYCISNAQIESAETRPHLPLELNDYVLAIVEKQHANQFGQRPTGEGQRVIKQTFSQGTQNHSTEFIYSGPRGSSFNYNLYSYNSILHTNYDTVRNFFMAAHPYYVLADTVRNYQNDTLLQISRAVYNPDNTIRKVTSESGPAYPYSGMRTEVNYNGQHLPESYYYSYFTTPGWDDTSQVRRINYLDGKILIDSTFGKSGAEWQLDNITKRHYDSNGQLSIDSFFICFPVPIPWTVHTLDYYPNGNLMKVTSANVFGGQVNSVEIDSLGYTDGIGYATYWKNESHSFETGITNLSIQRKYPGVSGLPDSAEIYQSSATATYGLLCRYEYNSFGNPTKITVFDTANINIPLQTANFYYEEYDPLSIAELHSEKELQVYPNPFFENISVRLPETAKAECTIKLLDVFGKIVFESEVKPGKDLIVIGRLSAIPAGIYILQLEDSKHQCYYRKVLKQ